MSMHQGTDVVIVGGGVIGCAIAYFLRKAGVEVWSLSGRRLLPSPLELRVV